MCNGICEALGPSSGNEDRSTAMNCRVVTSSVFFALLLPVEEEEEEVKETRLGTGSNTLATVMTGDDFVSVW